MSALPVLLGLLALAAPGQAVDDFACLDHAGRFQRLSRNSDARFVVLFTLADDCPIVRHNATELKALIPEFTGRGVRFFGLDAAPQDTPESIAAELDELGLELPVLLDRTQCVAEMLGVTRTAEALVIETKRWELVWRGPVDDRVDYGGQRASTDRAWLREALEAVLDGRAPPDDAPRAKGCALTYLEPREQHDVEYVRDVAPILERRCTPCHREGGVGPWAMTGHEKVRGWGAMIRDVLLTKRMTPWHVDPRFGEFEGDFDVTPEEVRTLVHWVERGGPRGEGEDPLAKPREPVPEWPLGKPDMIVELPVQEVPATGIVPYREIELQLDNEQEIWVRAVDLRPTNQRILHHAFAFLRGQQEIDMLRERFYRLPPDKRAEAERWLAERGRTLDDPPPEALGLVSGHAFAGRTYFAKYVPGWGIEEFPAGTGKRLPPRAKLVFEFHYVTTGASDSDRPRFGLYFSPAPPEAELKVASAADRAFVLAPGAKDVAVRAERGFEHDITVYALSPHMHYRGRSMRFTAVLPDGSSEVLLSVPEYRFDWQATYTLVEPRQLPGGTRIVCDGTFDNSSQNESNPDPGAIVRFGPRTVDEMFLGYIVYTGDVADSGD